MRFICGCVVEGRITGYVWAPAQGTACHAYASLVGERALLPCYRGYQREGHYYCYGIHEKLLLLYYTSVIHFIYLLLSSHL